MKRKVPADFMDKFMSGKAFKDPDTERVPSEDRPDTERIRKVADYGTFKKTEMVAFAIRMRPDDLAALREHFARLDVPISQGVRQIVLDYMNAKGLR